MHQRPSSRTLAQHIAIASPALSIAESVYGNLHYHLRHGDELGGLCGAKVMQTAIPIAQWGTTGHLPESWCLRCATLAGRQAP